MRIYEFAKLHDVASKDVLAYLKNQGVEYKNHMAVITSDTLTLLEKKYKKTEEIVSLPSKEEKKVVIASRTLSEDPAPSSPCKERSPMNEPQVKKTVAPSSSPYTRQAFEDRPFQKPAAALDFSMVENPLIIRQLTVGDFSAKAGKAVSDVIMTLLKQGAVCTKNHLLTEDQVSMLARVYELQTVKQSSSKPQGASTDSLRVARTGK